jgi:hypothetical protein
MGVFEPSVYGGFAWLSVRMCCDILNTAQRCIFMGFLIVVQESSSKNVVEVRRWPISIREKELSAS